MTSKTEQSSGVNRRPDWPRQLAQYVERFRNERFAWGYNDCLTFALRWERMVALRSRFLDAHFIYNTAEEANTLICEHGLYDVWEVLDQRLERDHFKFAQKGDLVAQIQHDQPSVGICIGNKFCAPGYKGLVFRDMVRGFHVWKV